jgi:hypothetical protein
VGPELCMKSKTIWRFSFNHSSFLWHLWQGLSLSHHDSDCLSHERAAAVIMVSQEPKNWAPWFWWWHSIDSQSPLAGFYGGNKTWGCLHVLSKDPKYFACTSFWKVNYTCGQWPSSIQNSCSAEAERELCSGRILFHVFHIAPVSAEVVFLRYLLLWLGAY